ncbi:MerR family DNA-binding transcriptional regulator [Streptomyces sp. NPDC058240]|uniref:MerR family DNA-binding transcriptional regulator n=1 Tax=Streptomyces sp. NPDC058240 TaxID=3346396 RepID=UPI0036EB331C
MRPVDLARRHGLSTQAVRNYEAAGIIPPAHRSRTGYRDCTATHAAGLAAHLALVPAFGYSTGRRIMHAVTGGQLDEVLRRQTVLLLGGDGAHRRAELRPLPPHPPRTRRPTGPGSGLVPGEGGRFTRHGAAGCPRTCAL